MTEPTSKRRLYGFWLSPYMSTVAHMLGEAGLEYEYVRVSPYTGGTHSEEHRNRNSLGKIPSLVEADGTCISESQSICRYLARTYEPAQAFYPCHDARHCIAIDELNDFLGFSVLGPFFNWFVMSAYFPQAFRLKCEVESRYFSLCSAMLIRGNLNRLKGRADFSPFLLGEQPTLPDFNLFYTLELRRVFAETFQMPEINLLAGNGTMQAYYDAMKERPVTSDILQAQQAEYPLSHKELFNDFGPAYEGMLGSLRERLEQMFGHPF